MTENEILTELKGILSTIKPSLDLSGVDRDTNLIYGLGLDSLSFLLLSLAMENRFGFTFDGTPSFNSVGDVVDFVARKTDGRG